MSFFSKLFEKFTPKEAKSQKSFEEIYNDLGIFKYSENGFEIKLKDSIETIKWAEIDEINAFKKDVYAYDLVAMEIVCGRNSFSVNEETPGWFQLVIKLKEIFESIPEDWEVTITQPPFATNFTTIYKRK